MLTQLLPKTCLSLLFFQFEYIFHFRIVLDSWKIYKNITEIVCIICPHPGFSSANILSYCGTLVTTMQRLWCRVTTKKRGGQRNSHGGQGTGQGPYVYR